MYLMTGATNDGRKDGAWCVIPGEPSLHEAGAVITHQCGGLFVVAHGVSSATHRSARRGMHAVALLGTLIKFFVSLDN